MQIPCDNVHGVGHLCMIRQNTGIANFPAVLLRRVTATSSFHGSSATLSDMFFSIDRVRYEQGKKMPTLNQNRLHQQKVAKGGHKRA